MWKEINQRKQSSCSLGDKHAARKKRSGTSRHRATGRPHLFARSGSAQPARAGPAPARSHGEGHEVTLHTSTRFGVVDFERALITGNCNVGFLKGGLQPKGTKATTGDLRFAEVGGVRTGAARRTWQQIQTAHNSFGINFPNGTRLKAIGPVIFPTATPSGSLGRSHPNLSGVYRLSLSGQRPHSFQLLGKKTATKQNWMLGVEPCKSNPTKAPFKKSD